VAAALTAAISAWSGMWTRSAAPPAEPVALTQARTAALSPSASADSTAGAGAQLNTSVSAPPSIEIHDAGSDCTDACRRHRSAFLGPSGAYLQYAYDTGGPIAAMPAITRDGDVIVASLSGKVARLSRAGTPVWTVDLGDRVYSSPLISDDLVLAGSDNHRVTALSLATGKTRWALHVEGEADTGVVETGDGVIIAAAGQSLYGLTRQGAVRFRVKAAKKFYASPAVADDGTIYIGSQDDHLYAISPRGAVLWRRDLGADIDCAATIGEGGMVYVGTDAGRIFALDRGGAVRWTTTVGGFVRGGLTLTRAGRVLAGTYGPEPRVVALDGATGAVRDHFAIRGTGAPEFGIHGSPLEDAAGNVYFGAPDHTLYALDATGQIRWTFGAGGSFDAPVVIGPDGTLYAGSDDGHLYALR
jgi:outer membrane protein assembly factor BamB